MGRLLAFFGVVMTLAACGMGGWIVARPPLALFLVPNATDIQVVARQWNEWQICYTAPGAPTPWYTDVAHQLEAQQWGSLDRVEYGSLTRTYSRASSFGWGKLWEWAFVTFDPLKPQEATIRVRRWVAISW